MEYNYKILEKSYKYEGKILKIRQDKVKLINGKTVYFEIAEKNNASAIVPINDKGNIIFVRQYRHAALKETLEIPAGNINKGETPEDCAKRELEEETSFKTQNLEFLFCIYPAVGFCEEKIYIYIARDLIKGSFNFDEDEFITTEEYSIEEAINLVYNGEIIDSKTIAAIFATKYFLNL